MCSLVEVFITQYLTGLLYQILLHVTWFIQSLFSYLCMLSVAFIFMCFLFNFLVLCVHVCIIVTW